MPVSPSSKVPATNLPNITQLRQGLDYGNPQLNRCSAFYDDVRGFRKKFRTTTGIPGPDLHNWKLREHHAGLDEMTNAYLDRHGNGLLFWPDSESAANYNKLHYSKDKRRIKRLMKQLFFRLNQQQYRNKRYKSKDKGELENSPQPKGLSRDDPIDLDTLPNSRQESSPLESEPNRSLENTGLEIRGTDAAVPRQRVKLESPQPGIDFEFHPTPEPIGRHISENNSLSKRKQDAQTPAQPSKRPKPTVAGTADGTAEAGLYHDKSPSPSVRRSSGRPRRIPHRPNFVPVEEYDSYIDDTVSEDTIHVPLEGPRNTAVPLPSPVSIEPQLRPFAAFSESSNLEAPPRPEDSSQEADPAESGLPPGVSESTRTLERRTSTPLWPSISRTSVEPITSHPPAPSPPFFGLQPEPPSAEQFGSEGPAKPTSSVEPIDSKAVSPAFKAFTATDRGSNPPLWGQPPPTKSSGAHGDERRQSSEALGALRFAAEGRPRPKIDFIYRVILSRTPIYSYRSWTPTRPLEETTLQQITEELKVTGLNAAAKGDAGGGGLIFTVEGPSFKAEERIPSNSESGFTAFVRQVRKAVKGLLAAGYGRDAPLVFEIEIEPMCMFDSMEKDEFDDDDFVI
ncbi:hypothetical protein BX600DRAFT_519147 [Xylariales sp. PMI_506]|nr:hypothetical protein BX600DRAFT_519147 [Xylariales sp. PMI_506]